ncbi:50S ribosomal protein L18a [Candidatus Micrarchaeota archaeon]|nr:50S ribosomal protein L18a [Candidatus Micrarchaeota archaeon]
MEFAVSGTITLGKESRAFSKTVEAPTEDFAKEKVFTLFGSMNGVKRNRIKIEKVVKSRADPAKAEPSG